MQKVPKSDVKAHSVTEMHASVRSKTSIHV